MSSRQYPSERAGVGVSIIVPCHNGAKYLARLADSLRPLLASEIEIIFIDDGSTDGSCDLFATLMPSAVCLRERHSGLGATRNKGATVAHGEFLQLLDADDTLEPDKLETQLRFARANSLDVVYSDWRMVIVEEAGKHCEPWVEAEAKKEIVEALLGGWWFPPNAALVRKSAFLAIGGCSPNLGNTCEDFDLWVRLGIAGFRYGYAAGRFANYYRYLQVRSMSRRDPREFFEGEASIILNAIRLLEAQGEATQSRRRAAARRLHSVARNAYGIDRNWYRRLMQDVRRLDPCFRAQGTLTYTVTARLLGLGVAERLALWKRSFARSSQSTADRE